MEYQVVKKVRFKTLLQSERGASMVEYALLLSLIALGSILGLTTVGEKVGGSDGVFFKVGEQLSGSNLQDVNMDDKDQI